MKAEGATVDSSAKIDNRADDSVLEPEINVSNRKEKDQWIAYFKDPEHQKNDYDILQRWVNFDLSSKISAMSSLSDKINNKFILFKLLDDNFYGFYDNNNFNDAEITKNLTLFKSIQHVYGFTINFHTKEKYGSFRKFIHLFLYYYMFLLRKNGYNVENLKVYKALMEANKDEKIKHISAHSGKFLFSDEEYLGYFYVIIYLMSNTDGFGIFRDHLKENYIAIFKPFKESLINHYEDLYVYKLKFDENNQKLYYYVSITTILFGFISLLLGILNVILIVKLGE